MDTTFVKGMQVLEALTTGARAKGATEIAKELNVTKSNAHRLLQTLRALDYVDAVDGKYFLTPKLWELGERVVRRLSVRELAAPEMRALAHETNETVHLSVLDKMEVIYLEKIDSPQPLRAYTEIGGRAPAYGVATGKALLAFQSPELLHEQTLHQFTKLTVIDRKALLIELNEVRRTGYAINKGEWREGIGGLASPIIGPRGTPVAAIGISGPTNRLTVKLMKSFAPFVCNAAKKISIKLGGALQFD